MNITARSNGNLRNKKPFKVLVCLVTLVAFLFNTTYFDVAWAVGTPSELPGGGPDRAGSPGFIFKELNPDTFSLPEYLGHVKDSWSAISTPRRDQLLDKGLARGEYKSPVVIHIQDAHCNYYAQKKIAEIIEYLNKQYSVDTVNLEGGAKGYDLSIFTDIHDKNIRRRIADSFVKEGMVNGSEYFAINNPEKISLWGIEDTKLYLDNLNVYRESLKYKDEADKHLKTLTHVLNNIKIKIYSQELLELDARYSQYKSGSLEFKDYLNYLIQTAKAKAIDTKIFTNIRLLSRILGEEANIDFKKANNQRDDLIDKLSKKLSKKSLEELVLKTVEFRSEKISQKDFYAYLANKANLVGLELKGFHDLQKYIVYISMYNAVDKIKVMEEMEGVENAIKKVLYQNDKQKELNKLSKNLAILKNIFNITLTKDDYKYYIDNKESFVAANYASFIEKEVTLYKITAQLDNNITDLDHYRENISKFYEYSFKRDGVFLKNIKGLSHPVYYKVNGTVPNAAVIVTGGFHTESLCELFKKANISYISIMPTFKNSDGYECPYFKILSGEKNLDIRETLPFVLKSALAIPDPLNPEMMSAMTNAGLTALPAQGKLTANRIRKIINSSPFQDDPGLEGRIVALLDAANGKNLTDDEVLKLYTKLFHEQGKGGFAGWGRAGNKEKSFTRRDMPVKIEVVNVEKRPEPVLKPSKRYEKDILNAGVLNTDGLRLLFPRRALTRKINGVRISKIGLYIHNKEAQSPEEAITVIDRRMLVPDDKNLTKYCGDVIALEDARVIEWGDKIFAYLTVVEKYGQKYRHYSAVTYHDRQKFLDKVRGRRESWEWAPLKRLINDGPCKDVDLKNFVPFGHPAIILDKNGKEKKVWFALYRPDIKERTTIRYAISEDGPAGAWKDMGEYMSVDEKTGQWLGPSTFVAGINDIPGVPPLEIMLFHVAAEMPNEHKYYDIRVFVSERDNPLSYVENGPIIVPDIENQYESSGWVPGAIYSCGAVLTGHNPKDNTYTFDVYYSGSDSVILMATVTLRITPSSAVDTLAIKNVISDLISLAERPKVDRVELVRAMKERSNVLIGEDQTKGPAIIRSILSAIAGLDRPVRNELEIALRTSVAMEGLSEVTPAYLNVVAQVAPIGQCNGAASTNRKVEDKLARYYNGVAAKSFVGEDIQANDVEGLARLITQVRAALDKSQEPSNARALLLLPAYLQAIIAVAAEKAEVIHEGKIDPRIRVQFVDQGDMPDLVTQFELGIEILEHVRNVEKDEKAEPSQRFLNLIAAMIDSDIDPRAILNELFKTVLKIRRIDWRTMEEQRKAWEAVAISL